VPRRLAAVVRPGDTSSPSAAVQEIADPGDRSTGVPGHPRSGDLLPLLGEMPSGPGETQLLPGEQRGQVPPGAAGLTVQGSRGARRRGSDGWLGLALLRFQGTVRHLDRADNDLRLRPVLFRDNAGLSDPADPVALATITLQPEGDCPRLQSAARKED